MPQLSDVQFDFRWPPTNCSPEATVLDSERHFVAASLSVREDFALIQAEEQGSSAREKMNLGILNQLVFRGLYQMIRSRSRQCSDKNCTRQHIIIRSTSENHKMKYCGPIRHSVWICQDEWDTKMEKHKDLPPYSRKTVQLKADIVLFGPRSMGDDVAHELGVAQLFLQEPHSGSYSGCYENPQNINLPHLSWADLQATPLLMESPEKQNLSSSKAGNIDQGFEGFLGDIDQFFRDLPNHDYFFNMTVIANKLRTKLLV
jgi:hypothetical protein